MAFGDSSRVTDPRDLIQNQIKLSFIRERDLRESRKRELQALHKARDEYLAIQAARYYGNTNKTPAFHVDPFDRIDTPRSMSQGQIRITSIGSKQKKRNLSIIAKPQYQQKRRSKASPTILAAKRRPKASPTILAAKRRLKASPTISTTKRRSKASPKIK